MTTHIGAEIRPIGRILSNGKYTKDEVHFYIDGTIYKYNSQGIILQDIVKAVDGITCFQPSNIQHVPRFSAVLWLPMSFYRLRTSSVINQEQRRIVVFFTKHRAFITLFRILSLVIREIQKLLTNFHIVLETIVSFT